MSFLLFHRQDSNRQKQNIKNHTHTKKKKTIAATTINATDSFAEPVKKSHELNVIVQLEKQNGKKKKDKIIYQTETYFFFIYDVPFRNKCTWKKLKTQTIF